MIRIRKGVKATQKSVKRTVFFILLVVVVKLLFDRHQMLQTARVVSRDYNLFPGKKIRVFQGPLKFSHSSPEKLDLSHRWIQLKSHFKQKTAIDDEFPRRAPDCEHWVVALSSEIVLTKWRNGSFWCLVVVCEDIQCDKMTSQQETFYFLSTKQQAEMKHPFVKHTLSLLQKEEQFLSRKNIGYLFAIRHGAKMITDADSATPSFQHNVATLFASSNSSKRVLIRHLRVGDGRVEEGSTPMTRASILLFDPIPYVYRSKSELTRSHDVKLNFGSIKCSSLGVVAHLSSDTLNSEYVSYKHGGTLLVGRKQYAFFIPETTTFMKQAFWGLLLPSNAPKILRAFIYQKFSHELNLAFIVKSRHIQELGMYPLPSKINPSTLEQMFRNFLASTDQLEYLHDALRSILPARIETLMVQLYEHGQIDLEDIYTMQEWLLALYDLGYQFPSIPSPQGHQSAISETPNCISLTVLSEPTLNKQPYLASPSFNIDKWKHSYADFILKHNGGQGSNELFMEWTNGLKSEKCRPVDRTIIKVVAMTMNDWPLLKDWVIYHGELIGYEHLYVIDGSTHKDCITFLTHARDDLGVNVIFSSAGLNELAGLLSEMSRQISKASDFVVKLDTDEFLASHKGNSKCIYYSDVITSKEELDCSLSPYAFQNALEQLRLQATGERLRFGYTMGSKSSADLCRDESTKFDIGLFPLIGPFHAGGYKTISDSRTLKGIDLGGHNNFFVSPFGDIFGNMTNLGVLHFHARCLETEVANSRKAVISHEFIRETDSDEIAMQKLIDLQKSWGNPIVGDEVCALTELVGVSSHKILFYLQYLMGCITEARFYSSMEGTKRNTDFLQFLNDARSRHGNLYMISTTS